MPPSGRSICFAIGATSMLAHSCSSFSSTRAPVNLPLRSSAKLAAAPLSARRRRRSGSSSSSSSSTNDGMATPFISLPWNPPWTLAGVATSSPSSASSSSSSSSPSAFIEEARDRYEPRDMPSAAPTFVGLVLTTALVFGLVLRPEEVGTDGVDLVADAADRSFKVAEVVVGEALPNSLPDAVAVALSEGFAGGVSSLLLLLSSVTINAGRRAAMRIFQKGDADAGSGGADVGGMDEDMDDDFSEAVANADFFYAKSAVTATLEAAEVPLAPVLGVVLAQVPYQLSKARARAKGGVGQLEEQQKENGGGARRFAADFAARFQQRRTGKSKETAAAADGASDRESMKKGAVNFMGIDGVDTVADLIKWLEYDVLVADYADFSYDFLPQAQVESLSGVTSGFFGAVAALSSQIYRDATLSAGYGTDAARAELAARDARAWVITYARTVASSAVLFGGYETLRKPLTTSALAYFSGGAEACIGSSQYDACVDVYLLDAVPSAILQSLTG